MHPLNDSVTLHFLRSFFSITIPWIFFCYSCTVLSFVRILVYRFRYSWTVFSCAVVTKSQPTAGASTGIDTAVTGTKRQSAALSVVPDQFDCSDSCGCCYWHFKAVNSIASVVYCQFCVSLLTFAVSVLWKCPCLLRGSCCDSCCDQFCNRCSGNVVTVIVSVLIRIVTLSHLTFSLSAFWLLLYQSCDSCYLCCVAVIWHLPCQSYNLLWQWLWQPCSSYCQFLAVAVSVLWWLVCQYCDSCCFSPVIVTGSVLMTVVVSDLWELQCQPCDSCCVRLLSVLW